MLPVRQRETEIKALVEGHRVVVLTGETGSGKTTQLPQILLDVLRSRGGGRRPLIGHTQPRRLAARSVAARIAEEMGSPLGSQVGYKVRFDERTSRDTAIKVLTDGMLLAELASDPTLSAYSAIIIDEAHERSLNIDFLLGYARELVRTRADLRVIVTSATIEPRRFSDFFGGPGAAPIIEVSGRTYPVELRYRPGAVDEDGEVSLQGVADAVEELTGPRGIDGDILVFLPGEREIRRCADALRGDRDLDVLPLFSRLTNEEQDRIFRPRGSRRRVILSTNIAETSLTVPGIVGVIDTGVERRSIYDAARKVQTLPIVPVSRASADQRKGRCGRVSAGVCVRLFGERDFAQRPAFTEPEIRRSNLAGVMLQMLSLSLPAIEDFAFLDPPDAGSIRDGRETLFELGALSAKDSRGVLTEVGRSLARLPVDPRVGRMMLAGAQTGCLEDVTVLAAALSIQDPRERPMERQRQADDAHGTFRDDTSDFLSLLNLWDRYSESRESLGSSALGSWCREHFVNASRMREWAETAGQLREVAKEALPRVQAPAGERDADMIHRALMTGLISNLACRESDGGSFDYRGVRGNVVNIFPGSALFKKNPKWIMAAEIVQTSRLYARTVARVEPEWIELIAGHMLERQRTDPHLESETGEPSVWERATMNGIVVVPRRRVALASIDPGKARELFIRDALVLGKVEAGGYVGRVRAVFEAAREAESKLRRRDVLRPERELIAWFDRELPPGVHDPSTLAQWRSDAACVAAPPTGVPTLADVLSAGSVTSDADEFPSTMPLSQEARASLAYRFKPGSEEDGLTATLEVADLPELSSLRAEWLVPGYLVDMISALIKLLPTDRRAAIERSMPVPEIASAAAELLRGPTFGVGGFRDALSEAVEVVTGVKIEAEAWNLKGRPVHLSLRVSVTDASGNAIASGRDIAELQNRLAGRVKKARAGRARAQFDRRGIVAWDFGELPETVTGDGDSPLHPALIDAGESCSLTLIENAAEAAALTRMGVRRLFAVACGEQVAHELRASAAWRETSQRYQAFGTEPELVQGLTCVVADRVLLSGQPLPRSAAEFEARTQEHWGRLSAGVREVLSLTSRVLEARQRVAQRLSRGTSRHWAASVADLREQAAYLLPKGFLITTPWERFRELHRYAEGMSSRLFALREDGSGPERELISTFGPYWKRFTGAVAAKMSDERRSAEEASAPQGKPGKAPLPQARRAAPSVNLDAGEWAAKPGKLSAGLLAYRWALEEARLGLFTPELGGTVSLLQLDALWSKV